MSTYVFPATVIAGSASASGSTTIGKPPANTNLRMLRVALSQNVTLATAGILTVAVQLNGATIFTEGVYMNTITSSIEPIYSATLDFGVMGFPTASGDLTVSLSSDLATGSVYVNGYFD